MGSVAAAEAEAYQGLFRRAWKPALMRVLGSVAAGTTIESFFGLRCPAGKSARHIISYFF
jgi:hypothetical protein